MDEIFDNMSQFRQSTRVQVAIPARYESGSLYAEGMVTDVSPEGLFFSSDFLDGCGERMKIWMEVPWQEGPLELQGEVCWVNDEPGRGGMGIKLIDICLDERMLLTCLGQAARNQAEGHSSLEM